MSVATSSRLTHLLLSTPASVLCNEVKIVLIQSLVVFLLLLPLLLLPELLDPPLLLTPPLRLIVIALLLVFCVVDNEALSDEASLFGVIFLFFARVSLLIVAFSHQVDAIFVLFFLVIIVVDDTVSWSSPWLFEASLRWGSRW